MKLKLVLLSAILLLSFSGAATAQRVSSLFSCEGNNYTLKFSDKDFVKTPSWNPEKDENAPLSIHKALEIARTTLNRCHPKAKDNWNLSKIELMPMGTDKWVYYFEFDCPYESCARVVDSYRIYIKLDGTAILPKTNDLPTEKLDTSDNPIRSGIPLKP